MDTLSYKTVSFSPKTVKKQWVIVDAENEALGRLASRVAIVLRGKHKPYFTPHADCGDNVIVINAEKVTLSGNKMEDKTYRYHTGYPGGQRHIPVKALLSRRPNAVVEEAVRRMLPKNRLGRALFRNLKVYAGNAHPHEAQNPVKITLNDIK